MTRPTFYYDVSSPYAYLAAERLDAVLGPDCEWQPVAFGFMLRELGKTPWSLVPATRAPGIAEVQLRADSRGLPPVRWPPGWPAESYTLLPLRAALVAAEHDLGKELTLALYRRMFVDGVALNDLEVVLEVASGIGLDPELVRAGIARDEIKDALRDATSRALARGVTGIPTVDVNGALFWGDDRLEEAAARSATPGPRSHWGVRRS